jgi:tetratricopeptide (TPR) repeat protein
MYIRTPKKYRGAQRRSVFSLWRFLGMLTMMALIVVGIVIYQNSDAIRPYIENIANETLNDVRVAQATALAPTPTPTRDPTADRVEAANFWERGAVNEALQKYLPILDAVPNDVNIHYRVTLGLITLGDTERALEYAERTVTANPFSSDAWAIRSWALDWAGDSGSAIASALRARELNSDNPRAYAYLSESVMAFDQTQRAIDNANRALELDPDSAEAYRARGFAKWIGLFDIAGAIEDITAAYEIASVSNPALASLYAIDLAQLAIGQGDFNGAISRLESVLEVNDQNAQALFWLGSIYFSNLGDFNQSAEYLNRCVRVNPDSIACHYLLGRAQARLELMSEAATNFSMAIELGSQSARHHWWAGNSQIALGNCTQALVYLRTGYDLAIAEGDAQLVSDYDAILPLCGASFGQQANPSPTPEADDIPDADDTGDANSL